MSLSKAFIYGVLGSVAGPVGALTGTACGLLAEDEPASSSEEPSTPPPPEEKTPAVERCYYCNGIIGTDCPGYSACPMQG